MSLEETLFDAGMFIGGLRTDDPRYAEAFPLLEAARRGDINVCTTVGILSEVYAALTWVGAQPPLTPAEASTSLRELVEFPSAIRVLEDSIVVALRMAELAKTHNLTARRIHDARHAATALVAGVQQIYTYDAEDWAVFESEGLVIVGAAIHLDPPG